jgi:hypothetical protein
MRPQHSPFRTLEGLFRVTADPPKLRSFKVDAPAFDFGGAEKLSDPIEIGNQAKSIG